MTKRDEPDQGKHFPGTDSNEVRHFVLQLPLLDGAVWQPFLIVRHDCKQIPSAELIKVLHKATHIIDCIR